VKRNFEQAVRGEMRHALKFHADLTPAQFASRRANGLRQQIGGAFDARAASVAGRRLQEGKSPDDCETCGNTGIQPRSKRVQQMVVERGLPVMACLDCDREPEVATA
jgi:hypothetical protein